MVRGRPERRDGSADHEFVDGVLIGRRALLAGAAGGILAACSTVVGSEATSTSTSSTSSSTSTTTSTTTTTTTTTLPPTTESTLAPIDPAIAPGWVQRENLLEGTDAWRITSTTSPSKRVVEPGSIEGYLDQTSARPGETLSLRVATGAEAWWIEVYRMGWYAGRFGRLMWTSPQQQAAWQWGDRDDPATRMRRALWEPRMSFSIGSSWPAGVYLIKLVTALGTASYVPLTVRRDDAAGSLLFVSAVTTWQAYNPWGGRSLYKDFETRRESDRSTVVSFDRPYALSFNWGAADFLTHELPLLALVEELGLDVAYATSIDLHAYGGDATGTDQLLAGRTAILSPAHDEYYSREMRAALEGARDRGVNLAFFGANAVYRSVRLEPDEEGRPFRQMANYRVAVKDPLTATNPELSTVQWRNPPLNAPENSLVGVQYFAANIEESMVLVDTGAWCFEGVDLGGSPLLPRLVAVEADGLGPRSREPAGLQVLASSRVAYRGAAYRHAMTYYSAPSGAGVFATGTIAWVFALDFFAWGDPRVSNVVRGVTANVLRAFAAGPAGVAHPSVATAERYRSSVQPG